MCFKRTIPSDLPYNDYFEYFGPDFKLNIQPSNMTNQNTPEYMDKMKWVLLGLLASKQLRFGIQITFNYNLLYNISN